MISVQLRTAKTLSHRPAPLIPWPWSWLAPIRRSSVRRTDGIEAHTRPATYRATGSTVHVICYSSKYSTYYSG